MSREQTITRTRKTGRAESGAVSVGGLREYTFHLDVDDGQWGTRDAATTAPGDYEWQVDISLDGGQTWRMVRQCVGCVGGRSKSGDLPSMTVSYTEHLFDDETRTGISRPVPFPTGALLRLSFAPLRGAMTAGIQGEGR